MKNTGNKYICQTCFHRRMCLEYNDECYSCIHYVNEASVVQKNEIAKEIFTDVEALMFANRMGTLDGIYYRPELKDCITELKKKYTGVLSNGTVY